MAAEFTIEQYKEWVEQTFPDNSARIIAENNFRDGFKKMADFVVETNLELEQKVIFNNNAEF